VTSAVHIQDQITDHSDGGLVYTRTWWAVDHPQNGCCYRFELKPSSPHPTAAEWLEMQQYADYRILLHWHTGKAVH